MLFTLASWLAALSFSMLVSAQGSPIATASNATYTVPSDFSQAIVLLLSTSPRSVSYSLGALTQDATDFLGNISTDILTGTLVELNSNNLNLTLDENNTLAYISCDASDYNGFGDINGVVDKAATANVVAIVMYSQTSVQCNLTGVAPNGYTRLYTTTAAQDAKDIFSTLDQNLTSSILNANTRQQLGPGGAGGSPSLGARSTAVAMIILYSITGIITALFLLIIVSGAVRAHRHPERYGPRTFGGRSRQSRARGLARAMLETIPIVKFGDNDPPKDVEMSDAANSSRRDESAANAGSTASTARGTAISEAVPAAATSSNTTDTGTAASTSAPGAAMAVANSSGHDDDLVACSICTEDFEKGQDIRLLPCNHKFHPACVDPWLLDVSGTCPLCRVDLRPAETSAQAADQDDMPPPLDPAAADATNSNSTGGRLRGLLRRLQPSTAEERIAALRRFREENAQTHEAAGAEAQSEEGHASRWERVRRRVGL